MDAEFPSNWEVDPLSKIASSFIGGGTPSTKHPEYWGGDIHWTTSKCMNSFYLSSGEKTITKKGLDESSTHLIPKGNLIFGTRVGVGKIAINKIDMAISQDLTGVIIDKEMYSPEFIAFQTMHPRIQSYFENRTRGTTIKGIPRSDLEQIKYYIPPLPEQKMIASALYKAWVLREKVKAAIDALKEIKISMLSTLFSYGPVPFKLINTISMRETEVGGVRDDWSIVALGNYSKMDYGTSKKCNPGLNGVPVLRIPNIVRGSLHSVDLSSLDPMLVERNKYLEDGDLLFVRTNATRENIGKTMVYEKQFEKASFASYLIRVKVDKSEFNPTYVHFFSQTEQGIAQLSGRASNAADGKFNINTQTLRTILLPKPSIDVQNQIVIILESIENRIAIEQQYLSSLEDLFSSLLDSLILGKVRVHDLEA